APHGKSGRSYFNSGVALLKCCEGGSVPFLFVSRQSSLAKHLLSLLAARSKLRHKIAPSREVSKGRECVKLDSNAARVCQKKKNLGGALKNRHSYIFSPVT
ncbi:hypothetical protein SKAU_G00330320, partial [Synaphobranchus kaupii]